MRARFLVLGLAVAGFGCNSILGNSPHEAAGGTGGSFGAAGSGGGASGTAGKGGGGGVAGGGAAGGAGQGGSTVGGSGGARGGTGGSTGGSTAGRGGTTGTGGIGGTIGIGGTGGSVGGGGTGGSGGGTAGRGGTTGTGGTGGTGGGAAGRGGTTGTGGTVGTGGSGGATVPRTLALLAGQLGGPGNIDGIGAAARFNGPFGIAIDASGNAFVADTSSHTIRRVVLATGAVSTIAGAPGVSGSADGAGAVARFNGPWGLALDTSGGFSTLYIADSGNNVIRRLDVSQNRVTTIAGTAGPPGSTDATGTAARFNSPRALALDSTTGLYVADSGNNTIRIIGIGTYAVTTLAGTAGASGLVDATGAAARFRLPNDLALDSFGNLFVSDGNNSAVRKVVPATGVVTTLASGGLIAGPASIAYNGDIIATTVSTPSSLLRINTTTGATSTIMSLANEGVIRFDPNNTSLYLGTPDEVDKIDVTAKTVSRVAGSVSHVDIAGTGLLAYPSIIGSNGADLLFVNSGIGFTLQQIVVSTGAATTYLSPTCLGSFTGIANVRGGTLTAACASSNTIVNMSQSGTGLTTVAGSDFVAGGSDGTGSAALFNSPQGLADDGAGNVYVADAGNHTIRKVVVATGVVTTLAGMAGMPGSAPGTGTAASFNGPTAVASDGAGNLYVADAGNHTIRQIVISSRIVSTLAGTAGMAGTTDGAGAAARFLGPTSVVADGAGNLYVSDGNTVREIALAGANVTTLVGVPGHAGVVLGALPAGLNRPGGMAVLPNGAVAITDSNENAVLLLK